MKNSNPPSPLSVFSRTRDLRLLWILRMLVRLGAHAALAESSDAGQRRFVFEQLSLPLADTGEAKGLSDRLFATLARMEKRACTFRHGRVLAHNLALLRDQIGLSEPESCLLAFAVLLRADETFQCVAKAARPRANLVDQLSTITGLKPESVQEAVSLRGNLMRSGLVEIVGTGPGAQTIRVRQGQLRSLARTRMKCVEELFGAFLRPAAPACLARSDYRHFIPGFELVAGLLAEATASRRAGVNILLYGIPGVGKSELTRTVAAELDIALYEVSSSDDDNNMLHPRSRLSSAATAQYLLAGRKAVLVFDEVDAIFTDGSRFFGKPTTAEQSKAWVNALLEATPIPTVWIANRIDGMDPAFLRRFDLVAELRAPPRRQRTQLLRRVCGHAIDETDIERLAHCESVTPALLTRAAAVASRMDVVAGHSKADLIESVLDGTLRAQGHRSIRETSRSAAMCQYDLSLCNASEDLSAIAAGLARAGSGRLCLYGPPGTGKSAFGHWLARELDRPLLLKRISDLQSPFVGVMERNLANAFRQAMEEGAVLQLDEVDTFLRDRSRARQSWEASQVNEFLTQLEAFDGILIASTNLMDAIDPAAMRRYDYLIEFHYMRQEQVRLMFQSCAASLGLVHKASKRLCAALDKLERLTPGDFAVIMRRHALMRFETADQVVAALRRQIDAKPGVARRIGFL